MLKVRYTCNDSIMAMVRDHVVLSVPDKCDACSIDTWKRVKRRFARRHHTKTSSVSITAVVFLSIPSGGDE